MSTHPSRGRLILFILLTCGALAIGEGALGRGSSGGGCSVIDRDAPPLYISLSPEQERFKERGRIALVLRNNTNCPITVEIGGEAFRPGELPIFYDVQDRHERSAPKPGNYRRCENCWEILTVVSQIPAGASVIFGVERKHAERRLTISIPFVYEWELPTSHTEKTIHRVYFRAGEWPARLP